MYRRNNTFLLYDKASSITMCDDIDCDGCCDGDCCDTNDCCCATTSSGTTVPLEAGGGAIITGDNIDHDCLFYLCCAGCFLCPLFYIGTVKRANEPITTPVESARPTTSLRNSIDDATVAATVLTLETENLKQSDSVKGGVPLTVTMDRTDMANGLDNSVPIASSPPMDRK